ncbi:ribonuclease J [Candidatus Peribacteria bacterium]|nr:ribonuclease J [Candidatus Peribacteria bacterium]
MESENQSAREQLRTEQKRGERKRRSESSKSSSKRHTGPSFKHDPNRGRITHEKKFAAHPIKKLPGGKHGDIRIVPLGGVGEIGQNMTMVEWGSDILLIDTGVLFAGDDAPGIDGIVPDVSYLVERQKNIRGVLYTHGHYDHVAGAKYILPQLGYPRCFASPLTKEILLSTCDEVPGLVDALKPKFTDCNPMTKLTLGKFTVEFFHVNHTIPDAMGIVIHTPYGAIVYSGDFKFDYHPADGNPANMGRIAGIGAAGVAVAMVESTNVLVPGFAPSEYKVLDELREIMEEADGRVILTIFGSSVGRVSRIIEMAEDLGRTVWVTGRSLIKNTQIARRLNYFKCKDNTLRQLRGKVKFGPAKKTLILCTGGQGEYYAALTRAARGEHNSLHLQKGDTVIFSASEIPGNENQISTLKNNLARHECRIINTNNGHTHATGHGYQEDLKLMTNLLNPYYFAPVHGDLHHRMYHRDLVISDLNYPEEQTFVMDNGRGLILNHTGCRLMTPKEEIKTERVHYEFGRPVPVPELQKRVKVASEGLLILTLQHKGEKVSRVSHRSVGFLPGDPQHEVFKKIHEAAQQAFERNYDTKRSHTTLEHIIAKRVEQVIAEHIDRRDKEPVIEVMVVG